MTIRKRDVKNIFTPSFAMAAAAEREAQQLESEISRLMDRCESPMSEWEFHTIAALAEEQLHYWRAIRRLMPEVDNVRFPMFELERGWKVTPSNPAAAQRLETQMGVEQRVYDAMRRDDATEARLRRGLSKKQLEVFPAALTWLVESGYVEKTETGRYRLTPRVITPKYATTKEN